MTTSNDDPKPDAVHVLMWLIQCHEYGVIKLPDEIRDRALRALELLGEPVQGEIVPPLHE